MPAQPADREASNSGHNFSRIFQGGICCKVLVMQCFARAWAAAHCTAVQAFGKHAHRQQFLLPTAQLYRLAAEMLPFAHAFNCLICTLSLAHVATPGTASLPLKQPVAIPLPATCSRAGQPQASVPMESEPEWLVVRSAPCPCVCLRRPLAWQRRLSKVVGQFVVVWRKSHTTPFVA